MGIKVNSFAELERKCQAKMRKAMEETVNKSFKDLHENVDNFYNSPEGVYKRTGQLAESPEYELSGGGNVIHGELRLDTSYKYHPSGRDTETIYGYAENGGLLGNGGFWAKTKDDIQRNIDESFGKEFGH